MGHDDDRRPTNEWTPRRIGFNAPPIERTGPAAAVSVSTRCGCGWQTDVPGCSLLLPQTSRSTKGGYVSGRLVESLTWLLVTAGIHAQSAAGAVSREWDGSTTHTGTTGMAGLSWQCRWGRTSSGCGRRRVSRRRRRTPNCLASCSPRCRTGKNDRYANLEICTLVKLAKVFHCSVDELLAGVDPNYDRILEGGAVGAGSARTWPDIAVVAEGDAFPDGIAWDEREQERPAVLGWLSRPGDLGDPHAYGIRIRGDSMLPAYRPNMIAIVSPELEVRAGDEVYVQLASGESLVRLLHTSRDGYILQPYNPVHHARLVRQGEIEAMHVIVYSRSGIPAHRPGRSRV